MLLDGVEGGDGAGQRVGAEQVPGAEAGEVLERAEEFVAADWWWWVVLAGGRGGVGRGKGREGGGMGWRRKKG